MNLFHAPARKFFISQCFLLKNKNPSSDETHQRTWFIQNKRNEFSVDLIWVQGVVICDLLNKVILDDGSGTANVFSIKDAPGFGSWLKNGSYVMVVGEVISKNPTLDIKAVKVTELSKVDSELLWNLEVIDFWKLNEKL